MDDRNRENEERRGTPEGEPGHEGRPEPWPTETQGEGTEKWTRDRDKAEGSRESVTDEPGAEGGEDLGEERRV